MQAGVPGHAAHHNTQHSHRVVPGLLQPTLKATFCQLLSSKKHHRCAYRRQGFRNHTARCQAASLSSTSAAIWDVVHTHPWQDVSAMIVSIFGGLLLVKTFDSLSHRNIVEKKLSRKLVHMLAGPGFVLAWPLFSLEPSARLFAAVVPSINIIRLLLIGSGIVRDERTVKSVSRSGDRGELLRGPLYYVVVLLIATVAAWRASPVPLIALSLMCGGDGLADIAGRNIGGPRLPNNAQKTWAGSLAMLIGGSTMALVFIYFFAQLGYFPWARDIVLIVAVSALAATLVESLPVSNVLDDNLTVPVVAAVTSACLLS